MRRQFLEIPGIMEGTGQPDYERCVAISTQSSLREMILPGVLVRAVVVIINIIIIVVIIVVIMVIIVVLFVVCFVLFCLLY